MAFGVPILKHFRVSIYHGNIHQLYPQNEVGFPCTALSLVTNEVKDDTQLPIK